jgi:LysR family transcriptional regulator, hydrogen peroxide-inducible genes activator
MTIQQLEYILSLNRHRHFMKAASECGVSQPTLSAMIQKLEDELDVKIFDRSKHPVEPTAIGERIIAQAQTTINEMGHINELVLSETGTLAGNLNIGIAPTIAPYIVPQFIKKFNAIYTDVSLKISEMHNEMIVSKLHDASLDMAIIAQTTPHDNFLEIPLYSEKFVAYMSPESEYKKLKLQATAMPEENLWVLQEGQCLLHGQTFSFCNSPTANHNYEAGSIDTLVRIVDQIGGYTVIPQMHLHFLTKTQLKNIREITSPPMLRNVLLIIREDYIKERMLNAVTDTIKEIIPEEMLDERLKKFAVKLR